MFDFFDRFFGYIEIAFEYFLNVIKTLTTAAQALADSIVFVNVITGFMPAMIAAGVVVFSAIMVAKFFLGR